MNLPGVLTWIVGGFIFVGIVAAIIKTAMEQYYGIKKIRDRGKDNGDREKEENKPKGPDLGGFFEQFK